MKALIVIIHFHFLPSFASLRGGEKSLMQFSCIDDSIASNFVVAIAQFGRLALPDLWVEHHGLLLRRRRHQLQ